MNELKFKTPSQILEKLLDKSGNLNVEYLRLDTAIEAMKLYHNQFEAPLEQGKNSVNYSMTPLESKILEAKGYGIKFVLIQENRGMYQDNEDSIMFTKSTTTADFEVILDNKLDYHRKRDFIGILTKHNLVVSDFR